MSSALEIECANLRREYRASILASIEGNKGYVIHGNYGKVRDLTWGSCDTMIWLDYPRHIVMYRVVSRTMKRIITREALWNGNVETLRKCVLSRDSIILWSWNTYRRRRSQYLSLNDGDCHGIQRMIVIRHPLKPSLDLMMPNAGSLVVTYWPRISMLPSVSITACAFRPVPRVRRSRPS
jgi:hypothetical protein